MHLPASSIVVLARGGAPTSSGTQSHIVDFIAAALFLAAGLLNLVKPDVGWRMSRWQYRNQQALQPSAAGLVVARVSGAVAVVVGVVLIVFALR